jgi:DNA transposition AAA+ family ATPase
MQQTFIWKTITTPQFEEIIGALKAAKFSSNAAMIIAQTGNGKSHAVNSFCKKHSDHTFRITVSDLYRKEDIIGELAVLLGIETKDKEYRYQTIKVRLDNIGKELIRLHSEGHKPQVIFDEAENMKITPLKMIKALYDLVKDKCSIVLIGTDQLLNSMYINKWKRNRNSLPQLYRRFKAGLKVLSPINKDKDYEPFFKLYNVPAGLQRLLITISDNYGDFQDYLEPTIRECTEQAKPLTEEFFRIKFNMPDTTKKAK